MNTPSAAADSAEVGFPDTLCGVPVPSSLEPPRNEVSGIPATVAFRLSTLPRWRPEINLDCATPRRDDE